MMVNMLPLMALPVLVLVLGTLIASGVAILKRMGRLQPVGVVPVLGLLLPLAILAACCCVVVTVLAGLTHSASAQDRIPGHCALIFGATLLPPIAALVIYGIIRRRHGSGSGSSDL